MNYFYSNRTNTVFEQPKQIITLPISWYTNIRIFYNGFGPKAFEWRHIIIPIIYPSKRKKKPKGNQEWGTKRHNQHWA